MKIHSQPRKGRVVMTGAELAATAAKEIPGSGIIYFGLMNGFGCCADEFLSLYGARRFVIAADRKPEDWLAKPKVTKTIGFVTVWKS
jgi:hypothetical protein